MYDVETVRELTTLFQAATTQQVETISKIVQNLPLQSVTEQQEIIDLLEVFFNDRREAIYKLRRSMAAKDNARREPILSYKKPKRHLLTAFLFGARTG